MEDNLLVKVISAGALIAIAIAIGVVIVRFLRGHVKMRVNVIRRRPSPVPIL